MKQLTLIFFCLQILNSFGQQDTVNNEAPIDFPIVIYYQNNSSSISHVNRLRLSILSEYLIENPSLKISIEGHVCCGPDYKVSKRRAKGVFKMLRKLDVPKEQMSFVGKSFDEPKVAKEKNETDKDLNRRVEIKMIK